MLASVSTGVTESSGYVLSSLAVLEWPGELAAVSPGVWMDVVQRKYDCNRTRLFIGFVWGFLKGWTG